MNASPRWYTRIDVLAVILVFTTMLITRWATLTPNELSWDVFGYYLYLPAAFIHHDPMLHDISWIAAAQHQYNTTGTLYQLTQAPDGSPVYFFLMGTALLYLPFFFIGHVIALMSGAPTDGFSMPYQAAIAMGCMVYALVALIMWRRILRAFLSPGITAVVLILIGLGTNYFHLIALKDPETANFLIFLITLLVWYTMRWHEQPRDRYLLAIGACVGLLALVKPSEITFGLIPLLWNVHDKASFIAKWSLLRKHMKGVLQAVVAFLLILLPQFLYWKAKTGHFVYDSYKNPGVGLDWWHPHVFSVLFSARAGWLIYTPIMAFALIGLRILWLKQRPLFWTVTCSFLASFFFVASWTEWWHGGSFSNRPVTANYVMLSLPLGYFLQWLAQRAPSLRLAGGVILSAFVALNLFQVWQHHHSMLPTDRMTMAYYRAVFGRTEVPEGANDLLLVFRPLDGIEHLEDVSGYWARSLASTDIKSAVADHLVQDTSLKATVLRMDDQLIYSPTIELPYEEVTQKDHFWARAEVPIMIPVDHKGELPCLVMTMERSEGSYGYRTSCVSDSDPRGTWFTLKGEFMTPPIRETEDRFKVYVWHRGEGPCFIGDISVNVLTPKR